MQENELIQYDALGLVELIQTRQVSASEVLDASIRRLGYLNPTLNCVITPLMKQARENQEQLATGRFRGVPFLMKDSIAMMQGVRWSIGSQMLKEFVPGLDTEVVRRLKSGGLNIIGKTNLSEFGLMPTTEPLAFGPTRNPWDLNVSAGGSSGGSAAAVAAGIVPWAHGNDGGGSIRIPASCCGLFGLKPTRGRNPLGPISGEIVGGFVVEHALSRTVRDSAALLDVTAGPDVGAPYYAPPPQQSFLQSIQQAPAPLKIAFSVDGSTGYPIHEDCWQAVLHAAKLCGSLGHHVEEATPELLSESMKHANMVLVSTECAMALEKLALAAGTEVSSSLVEPITWEVCQRGKTFSATDYVEARQIVNDVSREIGQFFEQYDLLLTPTLAAPPQPLGVLQPIEEIAFETWMEQVWSYMPFTVFCNFTGQPAMSMPLWWNDNQLPVGVQFAGRYGDETTLFQLATQLEAAQPWRSHYSSLWERLYQQ